MTDVIKPFAWLAAIAFVVGFLSYLALGQPAEALPQTAGPYAGAGSGEVSWPASDDWDFAKRI
jgi:hypothetical protein